MSSRYKGGTRNDYNDLAEIAIKITDISLNEYEEVLLYRKAHIPVNFKDGKFEYTKTPEESLLIEIPAMRCNLLEMYSLKSGNVYNPDNIIRVKLLNRWRKL